MKHITYIILLLILHALLYAQNIEKTNKPHQSKAEELKRLAELPVKYKPLENFEEVFEKRRGKAPSSEEGYYLPSLVISYMQTDSGIVKRRDSINYNSNGDHIFGIYQIDDGNGWINEYKDTAYYENRNDTSEYIYESFLWADTVWIRQSRNIYGYDSEEKGIYRIFESTIPGGIKYITELYYNENDELEQVISSSGIGDSINPNQRINYLYDSKGREYMINTDYWEAEAWLPYYRNIYLFDDNDNLAVLTFENFENSEWYISAQMKYTWDSEGNQLSASYKWRQNEMLVNVDSTAYKYNPDSFKVNSVRFVWKDTIWVYYSRYESISTDFDEQLSYISQSWNDSVWSNYYREFYEYDAKGNLLVYTARTGVADTGWVNEIKTVYTYDANDNRSLGENYVWMNMSWVQGNGYLYDGHQSYEAYLFEAEFIYIGDPIDIKDDDFQPDKFELAQNYPNPFNPETKISFSLPESGKASLKIYDVLGREVAELVNGEMEKGPHNISFSGSKLSTGVYIYRLQSGGFTESKKMLLLK